MIDVTSYRVERRAVWISGGDTRWYKNISNNVHYTVDRFYDGLSKWNLDRRVGFQHFPKPTCAWPVVRW